MIFTGETEVLVDRSVPALFVHKQPYSDWSGSETDPKRRESTDYPSDF